MEVINNIIGSMQKGCSEIKLSTFENAKTQTKARTVWTGLNAIFPNILFIICIIHNIHTYIIGHYNPSVRIIDLVSHTIYIVCVLILYISSGGPTV